VKALAKALNLPVRTVVIPAKAGIQYAAAYRFYVWRLWNTGSPPQCALAHKAGDDSEDLSEKLHQGIG
jgi:hypothetical protein